MATELRAMKNYAGHRLSPWLGHLMVSRQETARPLLTPGEVMQLPPDDELVLVSGCSPIRAKKARYFEDERFRERVTPPVMPDEDPGRREARNDDWSSLHRPIADTAEARAIVQPRTDETTNDPANSGLRREPELSQHEEVAPEPGPAKAEFDFADEEADDEVQRAAALRKQRTDIARQAAMDPGDGLGL
jgi:type IV secretion system protein VirD4